MFDMRMCEFGLLTWVSSSFVCSEVYGANLCVQPVPATSTYTFASCSSDATVTSVAAASDVTVDHFYQFMIQMNWQSTDLPGAVAGNLTLPAVEVQETPSSNAHTSLASLDSQPTVLAPSTRGSVSGGAIAGAVIGGFAALILLALIPVFLLKRRRTQMNHSGAWDKPELPAGESARQWPTAELSGDSVAEVHELPATNRYSKGWGKGTWLELSADDMKR